MSTSSKRKQSHCYCSCASTLVTPPSHTTAMSVVTSFLQTLYSGAWVKCLMLIGLSMTFFVANIASTSIAIVIFHDILPSLGRTAIGESLVGYRGSVIACVRPCLWRDGLPSGNSSPGPIYVANALITFFNGCVTKAGRGKTERRWQLDTITIRIKCPRAPVTTTLPLSFTPATAFNKRPHDRLSPPLVWCRRRQSC